MNFILAHQLLLLTLCGGFVCAMIAFASEAYCELWIRLAPRWMGAVCWLASVAFVVGVLPLSLLVFRRMVLWVTQ